MFWGQQGFGGNGGNTPSYPSGTSSSGSLEFNCYRHEEDWTATYNTQLTKYDHETGETLEGASFRLYERFDDKDQVNLERDGAVELYGGTDHETYLSNTWIIQLYGMITGLWQPLLRMKRVMHPIP